MNKAPQVVFNRIEDFKDSKEFIDLKDLEIMNNDEMARILSKFRNPKTETFRIIYMKDNHVKGYESLTSNVPNYVNLGTRDNAERLYSRFENQMERLNANGYYLTHNHCSSSSKPSHDDLKITQEFKNRLKGFLGHMIISLDEYSFIYDDEITDYRVEESIPLKSIDVENCIKKLRSNSIYNTKIDSRQSLIALTEKIKADKECSNVIITNCKCEPRLVMQIPNHMINFEKDQLNGYIKNLAKSVGGTRAFFSTTDLDTYNKSLEHMEYGTLKDSVLLEKKNNKLSVRETPDSVFGRDLFSNNIFDINCFESIYDYIPYELEKVPKGKIRILRKQVGKEPTIEVIDNTLEAKQKLVDGLIEVVPLDDVLLVCNEEGKLENMLPNIAFDYDYIAGDCFFIGDDYENGDFKSLTREQIINILDNYKDRFIEYEKDDDLIVDDEVR